MFGNNQDHDNSPALKRKLQENHIDSLLPPSEKPINQESHLRDPKLNPGDVSQDPEGNSGKKLEEGEGGAHMVSPEPPFSEERSCHDPDFEERLQGILRSLGQGQGLTWKQKNEPNFSAMTMMPEYLIFGVPGDKSPICQAPTTENCVPFSSSSCLSEGKIKR